MVTFGLFDRRIGPKRLHIIMELWSYHGFCNCGIPPKSNFLKKILAIFKSDLPPTDMSLQISDADVLGVNFHVDFKEFIGYSRTFWENVRPTPYLEGSKTQKKFDLFDFARPSIFMESPWERGPICITASGNILASGNLCFRVFKFQL